MNEPAKILIVDDEDAGRFVKSQTLARAGFSVIEAATGGDAIAIALRDRPDLVVLDVNLPDISGLEVCRQLRGAETGLPALQILHVSSTAVTAADRVRGLERGADVYLSEPVDGSVLVATVHALLRVRRAESELAAALVREREARQIAEELGRLKDEFIATLSHELRTPLNALMGWVWQLRHTSLEGPARERALDSLERNTRMQAQLIDDLLDVSRASKGKLHIEMRHVDLKEIVLAATEVVRKVAQGKGLDLRENLATVWVAGDPARLQQIVTNLLANAIQYTGKGCISVTLAEEGGDAVLAVQDTGAGIDAAFLPHVFDQFRQGEGGLSRKHGGLGLGLSVVKQLVDLHDGSVAVASPGVGHGAIFTVRFPRDATRSGNRPQANRLVLQDLDILLVVNGEATTLRNALESSGAVVSITNKSSQRDQSPATAEYDVIVLDDAGDGVVRARFPALQSSLSFEKSVRPSHIVRRIAEMVPG